jgi:hypothetical protein
MSRLTDCWTGNPCSSRLSPPDNLNPFHSAASDCLARHLQVQRETVLVNNLPEMIIFFCASLLLSTLDRTLVSCRLSFSSAGHGLFEKLDNFEQIPDRSLAVFCWGRRVTIRAFCIDCIFDLRLSRDLPQQPCKKQQFTSVGNALTLVPIWYPFSQHHS